jgi:hypothetical protein
MARLAITKLPNYTFWEYTYQPRLSSLSSTQDRELSLRHSLPKSTNFNKILTKLLDTGYSRLFGRKTGRIVLIIEVTRTAKQSPADQGHLLSLVTGSLVDDDSKSSDPGSVLYFVQLLGVNCR